MTSLMFIPLLFKHTFSLRPDVLGLISGQKCGAGYENRNYATTKVEKQPSCPKIIAPPPPPVKPVTHVIFDLDGTILNTEDLKYEAANEYVCRIFKKEVPIEIFSKTMGYLSHEGASVMVKELYLPINPAVYLHGVWQALRGDFLQSKDLRGVKDLIEHLACNNIPMALASSSTQETFDLKARNHKKLFKRFCPIVLGGSENKITRGKPHPDIYYLAASRFAYPPAAPENVLVFEDSHNGVLAAKAAGMQTAMIPAPWLPKHLIDEAEPTLLLKNLEMFDPKMFDLPDYPPKK